MIIQVALKCNCQPFPQPSCPWILTQNPQITKKLILKQQGLLLFKDVGSRLLWMSYLTSFLILSDGSLHSQVTNSISPDYCYSTPSYAYTQKPIPERLTCSQCACGDGNDTMGRVIIQKLKWLLCENYRVQCSHYHMMVITPAGHFGRSVRVTEDLVILCGFVGYACFRASPNLKTSKELYRLVYFNHVILWLVPSYFPRM